MLFFAVDQVDPSISFLAFSAFLAIVSNESATFIKEVEYASTALTENASSIFASEYLSTTLEKFFYAAIEASIASLNLPTYSAAVSSQASRNTSAITARPKASSHGAMAPVAEDSTPVNIEKPAPNLITPARA